MAHECIECGGECRCHGDIDDIVLTITPDNCRGCGCEDYYSEDDDEEYDDGPESPFVRCPYCDGHPACEDFGCAYKFGLGHMVQGDLL